MEWEESGERVKCIWSEECKEEIVKQEVFGMRGVWRKRVKWESWRRSTWCGGC